MKFSDKVQYTTEHMWVQRSDDGFYLAGITDYAQNLLGDLVFVEPPMVGSVLEAGKSCGIIESVKTGADLFAPLNGIVTEINVDVINSPDQIQDNPYQSWIFKIEAKSDVNTSHLLDAASYKASVSA